MSELSHPQRADIKDYVCRMISDEWDRLGWASAIPANKSHRNCKEVEHSLRGCQHKAGYTWADQLISEWATASSAAIQLAAKKMLLSAEPIGDIEDGGIFQHIVGIVYSITQRELKARGLRYVKLYRGQHHDIHSLRTLQSATTSLAVARSFGKCIYSMSVPVRFIASTFFTGYGCAEEQEYVLLGEGRLRKHVKLNDDGRCKCKGCLDAQGKIMIDT